MHEVIVPVTRCTVIAEHGAETWARVHVERALPLLGPTLGFPWWEFGVNHDDQRYQADVTVCFMAVGGHLDSYERC